MEEYDTIGKIKDVILTGRIKKDDAPAEGHLVLEVKTRNNILNLHCFIDNNDAWLFHSKKMNINDNVKVRLYLGGDYTSRIKSTSTDQRLEWVENPPLLNPAYTSEKYNVAGRIVDIKPHSRLDDHNWTIVNCGDIYIYMDTWKNLLFEVGDYVKGNGRLDAHILERVRYEK